MGLSGLEVLVWHLADLANLREGRVFVGSGLVKGLIWPWLDLCKEKDSSEVNGPYNTVSVWFWPVVLVDFRMLQYSIAVWVDFDYWWGCIGLRKGLSLQPVQHTYPQKKSWA